MNIAQEACQGGFTAFKIDFFHWMEMGKIVGPKGKVGMGYICRQDPFNFK